MSDARVMPMEAGMYFKVKTQGDENPLLGFLYFQCCV